jgi:hypothetical protein
VADDLVVKVGEPRHRANGETLAPSAQEIFIEGQRFIVHSDEEARQLLAHHEETLKQRQH